MVGDITKTVKQLARRAGAVSLACLAFALGAGSGAYLLSVQHAAAADRTVSAPVESDETSTMAASRGRELPVAESVVAVSAVGPQQLESDVHTVARPLSVQSTPSAGSEATPPRPVATVTAQARQALVPPQVAPAQQPGTLAPAQVTFYYCSGGFVGDGGGFCGYTADGTPVQVGVAACDRAYMGQQFRVVGDPSGLVFRCADTGGAVHGSHRDMWFPTPASGGAWLAGVGYHVTIEVLQ